MWYGSFCSGQVSRRLVQWKSGNVFFKSILYSSPVESTSLETGSTTYGRVSCVHTPTNGMERTKQQIIMCFLFGFSNLFWLITYVEWSLISTAIDVLGTHLFMRPLTIITGTVNTNSYRAITCHIILTTSPFLNILYCITSYIHLEYK